MVIFNSYVSLPEGISESIWGRLLKVEGLGRLTISRHSPRPPLSLALGPPGKLHFTIRRHNLAQNATEHTKQQSTRKSQSWTYSEPWNRPGLPTQYHKESNRVSIEKTIIARAITFLVAFQRQHWTDRNLSPESLLLSAELWKLGQRILNSTHSTPASFGSSLTFSECAFSQPQCGHKKPSLLAAAKPHSIQLRSDHSIWQFHHSDALCYLHLSKTPRRLQGWPTRFNMLKLWTFYIHSCPLFCRSLVQDRLCIRQTPSTLEGENLFCELQAN